jgi:hypothetical protein
MTIDEEAQEYLKNNFLTWVRIIKDEKGREFILSRDVDMPKGFKVVRTVRLEER